MSEVSRGTAVVVEDDDAIRQLVGVILEQIGLEVIAVSNGADGVKAVQAHAPLVVTLDINMPGIDGFETAKRIRAISSSYIVMLTARDEEIDALQGLESGADDYVLKPFRPRELRARIEAMLRRPRTIERAPEMTSATEPPPNASTSAFATPTPEVVASPSTLTPAAGAIQSTRNASANWLQHSGLRLDADSRLVELDGTQIELTRSEFDLLRALLETQRRVRSKSDLAGLLRGENYVTSHYVSEADRRGVEVHVANLRKKLGDDPKQPRIIETVRGAGYRLTAAQN
jgi:two-component system, OmpR family, response regulator